MGRVGCLLAPQAHGTLLLSGSLLVGFYELCPNGHSGSQENVKVKTLNRVSPVDYPATRSEIKGFCQNPIFFFRFVELRQKKKPKKKKLSKLRLNFDTLKALMLHVSFSFGV